MSAPAQGVEHCIEHLEPFERPEGSELFAHLEPFEHLEHIEHFGPFGQLDGDEPCGQFLESLEHH